MNQTSKSLLSSQVSIALETAIKNLIYELSLNDQIYDYQDALLHRKQYDKHEKNYLEKEKLKKQLGVDYESSGSQDEEKNNYEGLTSYDYKSIIKQNLLKKNIDPKILSEISNSNSEWEIVSTLNVPLEHHKQHTEKTIQNPSHLNIITENQHEYDNTIVVKDLERKKLFGLRFLIDELQKINKKKTIFGHIH